MTRWVDEHLLEEREQRVRSRPEVMKRRKERAEHPFGTMKRWWDHGYLLMRGLEKVRTECSVTVLAYNLRRVLNLVGMARRMAALGEGLHVSVRPGQSGRSQELGEGRALQCVKAIA
jgi:hypothetical protein